MGNVTTLGSAAISLGRLEHHRGTTKKKKSVSGKVQEKRVQNYPIGYINTRIIRRYLAYLYSLGREKEAGDSFSLITSQIITNAKRASNPLIAKRLRARISFAVSTHQC